MSSTEAPQPVFVQAKPYKVDLEPGKTQPFCDGSHRGGPFKPKKIVVDEAKTFYLCGCKYTHDQNGFCDGTHRKEEGIKKYNEFLLKANNALKQEKEDAQAEKKHLEAQLKSAKLVQTVSVGTALSVAIAAAAVAAKYAGFFDKR
ncbi:hypothetical protein BCR43DRAFT_529446 [Syncephalastrum racemosum]|uniref:Iron-binding zinc finger CDGSH type domain-containing protein n=1 Tax=Syncephalastrum racemosum TaxID=13706 RepID=A0A1X2HLW2_SYNRA|nr:hypothetical protein BCR43DRAFT_529446 [Syncephalastrum racemosum]